MESCQLLTFEGIDFKKQGDNLIFDCPFCGAKHKMELSISKKVYHCWVCDEKGNLNKLAKYFGIEIEPDEKRYDYNRDRLSNRHEKHFFSAPVKRRAKVYRFLINELSLSEDDEKALLARKFTKKEIEKLQYRSYPTQKEIERIMEKMRQEHLSPFGVPGFYMKNGNFTMPNDSGIMIPVRNNQGDILGFQIRHKEGKPKYTWLSTNPEKTDDKGGQKYPKGTKATNDIHCRICNRQDNVVYLTEGPLKADMLAMKQQVNVIAVPGVSALQKLPIILGKIRFLYDIDTVREVFDMDKTTNPNVQKCVHKAEKISISKNFNFKKSYWDYKVIDGQKVWLGNFKGIDDWICRQ